MPAPSFKNPYKRKSTQAKRANSGRKLGTPNKSTLEKEMQVIELLDSVVDWINFYTKVYKKACKGDMFAATLLDNRRWGRPRQSMQITGAAPVTFVDDLK